MSELLQYETLNTIAQVQNSLLLYIPIVIFTYLSFNMTQNLRSAINEGQKVRVLPKVLVTIFCTFVLLISCFCVVGITTTALYSFSWSYIVYMQLLLPFHIFIYLFQLVMVWYPKP